MKQGLPFSSDSRSSIVVEPFRASSVGEETSDFAIEQAFVRRPSDSSFLDFEYSLGSTRIEASPLASKDA